jgi:transposase
MSGPKVVRWVVERSFAWLHAFKRLAVRWGYRADIHTGLLKLAGRQRSVRIPSEL